MSQSADLYTILRFYANRTHAPDIAVDSFIVFLEKYAKRHAAERPDLGLWAQDTSRKVWAELPGLSKEGKCVLYTNEKGTLVTIPHFYVDAIQHAYKAAEESPELPFPDETALKLILPATLIRNINLELDLGPYLAAPQETPLPILKVVFPEGSGSVLILAPMVPKRLLELSLLKIRQYLRSHNNKEYVQHKLAPAFQGKESQLKEALNQLLVRPFDALNDLEKAGDFSFPFWAYFTSLVKGDIKKKNDRLAEDTAVLQSVLVVEIFNNYYKGKVTRQKEAETAFRNLELQLEKAPFFFTLDDIIRFPDTKGIPLLGQYTQEALEAYIKSKTTTAAGPEQLPELLILHGIGGERWFVRKSRMLPLCVRLLGEARPRVKAALSQRWYKLMGDYRSEPAMEDDQEFEQELAELGAGLSPALMAVLEDQKLYLVHEELAGTENGIPEAGRLFYKGTLAPMSELLLIKRKDLLTDVRMLLPFWLTIPVISGIIAFFKSWGKRRKPRKIRTVRAVRDVREEPAEDAESLPANGAAASAARRQAFKAAAQKTQNRLVPEGYTPDSYLLELQDRWNRLINVEAKENLTEDVNSLIRDYLRRTIRTLRSAAFTAERITELSDSLAETPTLQKLPARESLRLYIHLYIAKLLSQI